MPPERSCMLPLWRRNTVIRHPSAVLGVCAGRDEWTCSFNLLHGPFPLRQRAISCFQFCHANTPSAKEKEKQEEAHQMQPKKCETSSIPIRMATSLKLLMSGSSVSSCCCMMRLMRAIRSILARLQATDERKTQQQTATCHRLAPKDHSSCRFLTRSHDHTSRSAKTR